MIPLTNYVSKIIFNEPDLSHAILTYVEFNSLFTKKYIIHYLRDIIKKNPILKNKIVRGSILYIDQVKHINLDDYYDISYTSYNLFDNNVDQLLNAPFSTELQWCFKFYIDTLTKKTRMYFKINHVYADGYQIIKILTPGHEQTDLTTKLNRSAPPFDILYYSIFGFIFMCVLTLKFFLECISRLFQPYTTLSKTVSIKCNPLSLSDIRTFAKANHITVNDFLYSLMVKTDNYYTQKERQIYSCSPINISGTSDMNNMCPLFLSIINTSPTLLRDVHHMFAASKYSPFIPFFSSFLNNVTQLMSINVLSFLYNACIHTSNYTYSNIIGPSNDFLRSIKATSIHFLTTTKSSEICYNIISYEDNINIIITFKEGVIKDKKRFKECIYEAYKDLLKTNDQPTSQPTSTRNCFIVSELG